MTATEYGMKLLDIVEFGWGEYSDLYHDIYACLLDWDDNHPQELAQSIRYVLEYYDISPRTNDTNRKLYRLLKQIENATPTDIE